MTTHDEPKRLVNVYVIQIYSYHMYKHKATLDIFIFMQIDVICSHNNFKLHFSIKKKQSAMFAGAKRDFRFMRLPFNSNSPGI